MASIEVMKNGEKIEEIEIGDNKYSTMEVIEEANKKMSFQKGDILLQGSVNSIGETPQIEINKNDKF